MIGLRGWNRLENVVDSPLGQTQPTSLCWGRKFLGSEINKRKMIMLESGFIAVTTLHRRLNLGAIEGYCDKEGKTLWRG